MFKVHEKFKDRELWIRLSEIQIVYRMSDDCTVIMLKDEVYFHVTDSLEDILAAIKSEVQWNEID